jgi:ABC-type multidrug transport system fused ATPase/permease subunit
MTSVERVIEYVDLKAEESGDVDHFVPIPSQWPMGEITFDNLSFRYASSSPWVLQNLNLSIQPNEKVFFVELKIL